MRYLLLFSIVFPLPGFSSQCDLKLAANGVEMITIALEMYKEDCGHYPKSLSLLVNKQDSNCKGYLKSLPVDPWRNFFRYKVIENGFELFSPGKDGIAKTGDDVDGKSAEKIESICNQRYLLANAKYLWFPLLVVGLIFGILVWLFIKRRSQKNS